ncbi:hypothetical protein M885DRAFT_559284 [Pelagophyceae sp. CCMP2097]|nr:hypothetical protein M885DRAFT_559284 [Pelagophyceae sp. CCMP2097]
MWDSKEGCWVEDPDNPAAPAPALAKRPQPDRSARHDEDEQPAQVDTYTKPPVTKIYFDWKGTQGIELDLDREAAIVLGVQQRGFEKETNMGLAFKQKLKALPDVVTDPASKKSFLKRLGPSWEEDDADEDHTERFLAADDVNPFGENDGEALE